MVFDVTLVSWAGTSLQQIAVNGLRSDVCKALAEYPGAGSAIVADSRGNVEIIGKGAAFVSVDGKPRGGPVVREQRRTYRGVKVRAPRSWYGAGVAG